MSLMMNSNLWWFVLHGEFSKQVGHLKVAAIFCNVDGSFVRPVPEGGGGRCSRALGQYLGQFVEAVVGGKVEEGGIGVDGVLAVAAEVV